MPEQKNIRGLLLIMYCIQKMKEIYITMFIYRMIMTGVKHMHCF